MIRGVFNYYVRNHPQLWSKSPIFNYSHFLMCLLSNNPQSETNDVNFQYAVIRNSLNKIFSFDRLFIRQKGPLGEEEEEEE